MEEQLKTQREVRAITVQSSLRFSAFDASYTVDGDFLSRSNYEIRSDLKRVVHLPSTWSETPLQRAQLTHALVMPVNLQYYHRLPVDYGLRQPPAALCQGHLPTTLVGATLIKLTQIVAT